MQVHEIPICGGVVTGVGAGVGELNASGGLPMGGVGVGDGIGGICANAVAVVTAIEIIVAVIGSEIFSMLCTPLNVFILLVNSY